MRTTVLSDRTRCTGCAACAERCPESAIAMKADGEGFLYPAVDPSRCVECGRCERECPAVRERPANRPALFGARNLNPEEREASSSGGVFSLLAEAVLAKGGAVFGAVFDQEFRVEHVGAITRDEAALMRGSKYVQSDVREALGHARSLAEQGIPVLFSGTPCQTAGLASLFGKRLPENLVTVDFVCHGVPSPAVFASYLAALEKEAGSRLAAYSFRDKRLGWKNFSAAARFENGTERTGTQTEDPFLRGFLANLYLRPSCHGCGLRHGRHASDITLADLWGAGAICPEKDDDRGLSLVFANTGKGRALLESLDGLERFPLRAAPALSKANPSIYSAAPAHPNRARYFRLFERHGFREKDVGRCLRVTLADRAVRKAKRAAARLLGVPAGGKK